MGIKNIREYEEREMRCIIFYVHPYAPVIDINEYVVFSNLSRFHREKTDRMRDLDNELERIRSEIEYLRPEDRNKKVEQELDKVC